MPARYHCLSGILLINGPEYALLWSLFKIDQIHDTYVCLRDVENTLVTSVKSAILVDKRYLYIFKIHLFL